MQTKLKVADDMDKVTLVELINWQGGLAVLSHTKLTCKRIGHYYADFASRQAAEKQCKEYAKKHKVEFLDNTF